MYPLQRLPIDEPERLLHHDENHPGYRVPHAMNSGERPNITPILCSSLGPSISCQSSPFLSLTVCSRVIHIDIHFPILLRRHGITIFA